MTQTSDMFLEAKSVAPFTRTCKLGMVPGAPPHALWVEIEWDGKKLRISGVLGPRRYGGAETCGQIRDQVRLVEVGHGQWDEEARAQLYEAWNAYHLNDMQAGTPAQMAELKRVSPNEEWRSDPRAHYRWAKAVLAEAGLDPDRGHDDYRYGSAWLSIEVPADVLEWLASFDDQRESYPWS